MQAGDLKHYITIQQKTLVPDGLGGFTETWTTFQSVYAAIWPMRASERVNMMQVEMNVTHRIRIRYLQKINSDMRISYGNRIFKIEGIANRDERNKYLEILCSEVV